MRKIFTALTGVLLLCMLAPAQELTNEARSLMARPALRLAFGHVDQERKAIIEEWIRLTEINAPSGKERPRAEAIHRILRGLNMDRIYYDAVGNLIAVRRGADGRKPVVFDAHIDTVFQEGLKIRAEIRDGRIYAPGIGDNTRNVEALLASIRALNAAGIRTKADLVFVFSVEEETTMLGAEHFMKENRDRIGQYVALDGGYEGLTYGGIGINWYRHHFIGPGGHTRSRTPPYSATWPMARAIDRIYQLELPEEPTVNINIGMLGGADVVNAKAADAWFTVDLRSTDQRLIDLYERRIEAIIKEEADRAGIEVKTEVLSKLKAAQIPGNRHSFTVRMAEAVHRAIGFYEFPITATASNNANIALLAGIPAMSTGTARCGNAHAPNEWCDAQSIYLGIKKTILLQVALAGLDEAGSEKFDR